MDTEVAPDRRKPFAALNMTSGINAGEKEAATENTEETNRAVLMSFLRGIRSAMNIIVNNPKTIPRVEKETAKLLWLAVSEK